jgi:hypothetical protein
MAVSELKIMNSNRTPLLVLLALALVFGATARLSAQIISTTVATSPNGETVDLQSSGPTDWIQFGVSGTTAGFGLSNELSGGSVGGLDTVGALTESNDAADPTGAGGTQNTENIFVSYTNGTSPTASTSLISGTPAGQISSLTGFAGVNGSEAETNGTTLSFTIDFNQAISSGTITLAGDTFGVTAATFTATLSNGNTTTTDTAPTTDEQNEIFTIDLSNITAGSSLTLSQELVTGSASVAGGGFDDLAFNGVALNLTAAPEPSTWIMLALGGIVLLIVRLKWKGRAGSAISRFGSI